MKLRRKELGYSADYVAEKLGTSRSTIFRYEAGDIEKLPLDILGPLSLVLKTTPAYLMGWAESSETDSTISRNEAELLRKYNALDDIGKYTVDTALNAQYERCTKPHLTVVAAHSDDYSEEQQKLMREDLDSLERLHKKRKK